jgi:RecB family exonuclease
VPTLSFLDSFQREPIAFQEYKTGKTPWTQERVDKHGQLLMYCSALRASLGAYPACVHLIWLRTQEVSVTNGMLRNREIELTGEAQIFPRYFTKEELDAFDEELLKVALEISEAYGEYKKNIS